MTDTLQPVDLPTTTSSTPVTSPVCAVVVTRGRTPYLATTLAALAAQSRPPLRVLLVDVGRDADPSVETFLQSTFAGVGGSPTPALRLVHTPGARTFGHAVRRALEADDAVATTWLWLLHDDSAPAPGALSELVRAVAHAPSVAVAGAKQRTWTDPERLLEVGLRSSLSGRRMTDVEPGELDQGQHDGRDDVLAVGIAGALVRREVWELLGGTDPLLGPFGDGFDLSRRARLAGHRVIVVPSAVVRHAQAGYLGLRSTAPDSGGVPVDRDGDGEDDRADPRRSFAARRRALVHSRLVSAPPPLVPLVAVMALLAAVVRSLGQLAAKQPGLAVDEVRAALAALARPDG
ncbi:glycosyltransferase, partial [uncultured Cellulomonas sp.]|uniref:glycosyltransferase family 2 protein n=1 Tax=uncultured Cellulomonas sp. TaxID=189682 RepID=UPI0028E97925